MEGEEKKKNKFRGKTQKKVAPRGRGPKGNGRRKKNFKTEGKQQMTEELIKEIVSTKKRRKAGERLVIGEEGNNLDCQEKKSSKKIQKPNGGVLTLWKKVGARKGPDPAGRERGGNAFGGRTKKGERVGSK